ncbi:FecR family protein [Flavivirga aquimarina]|uniref:FecR family protein n=1 Tax=Flavivirga aquimarina TaxID=2027862 RepID=A0ABT8W8K8_9FLAO|nr:FecR family protein [Flavivirga aquimarina]MDO5969399.1 FecR family protein [Flavivirga aquimarina]
MKKITIKYITNTISSKEISELKVLLREKKNQELFKDYIKDYYDIHTLLNKPDIDSAYKKIWDTINEKEQPRQYVLPNWFKYSAAALIVLMFSLSYFFKNNQKPINNLNSFEEVVSPGVDKATLTLEDGSSVVLEKGQYYNTEKVKSNGEQIIYNKKGSASISYNYLTVPRGGKFEVKLADGTQVWLNSESKLKYPVTFKKGETRQVVLVYGEAYFDVSPSKNHNGATFKVVSNLQEVEVLGTEFNIKAYKDEESVYTTLAEGKVSVRNEVFKEKLKVGEQSVLNEVKGNIKIQTVNVYNETAWRKGIFSFKNKPLKDIMKSLSRWYDIDIIIENKKLEDIRFNGVLSKSMNLEEILEPIKRNINLNYKVYDKKIVLE